VLNYVRERRSGLEIFLTVGCLQGIDPYPLFVAVLKGSVIIPQTLCHRTQAAALETTLRRQTAALF
jgi:hypothetical protein